MSQKNVIIDKLNIHVPNGWQGDAVYLARKISEQIQRQSADLTSQKQINLSLQGNYSGVASRVSRQLSDRLRQASVAQKKNSLAGDGQ